MQDRELVAAIVAGDADALAEAYDRYATPLYSYCRSMLPDPHTAGEAADAVTDIFIVATSRLPGLRDPDQLGAWLHAVARNECLRQLGPAVAAAGAGDNTGRAGKPGPGTAKSAGKPGPGTAKSAGTPAPDATMPDAIPPAELRVRVLQVCADSTPAGRAYRVSVAHRAGQFGRTGFPKPAIPPGPRWWREVRRHPWASAGVAAATIAVVTAGIAALLIAGGSHRAQASTVALGGGEFATAGRASSPADERTSPSGKPMPAPRTRTSPAVSPTADPATSPRAARSSALAPLSVSRSSGSPSRSPSPSPPPTRGTLQIAVKKLALKAVKGKSATGTFIVRTAGGPVSFAISAASAKVTVSPSSGSLSSARSAETITVTVTSRVSLKTHLTVKPGNLTVTVVLTVKA